MSTTRFLKITREMSGSRDLLNDWKRKADEESSSFFEENRRQFNERLREFDLDFEREFERNCAIRSSSPARFTSKFVSSPRSTSTIFNEEESKDRKFGDLSSSPRSTTTRFTDFASPLKSRIVDVSSPLSSTSSKIVKENESSTTERRGSVSREVVEMKELADRYQWSLDVKEFTPDELKVSVAGSTITVEGKHEEAKDAKGYASKRSHHFSRSYTLPPNVDAQGIDSRLTPSGQLIVEAPKRDMPKSVGHKIPIVFKSSSG